MSDTAGKKYYGKYMGVVVNNINPDPQAVAYIQVTVPDVLGLAPSSWAKPCVPVAGLLQSGVFLVPPIGSSVWVEFEQGDPGRPIWTGGFWGSAMEAPLAAMTPPPVPPGQNIVIQTPLQNSVIISDAPPIPMPVPIPAPASPGTGGIILRSKSGAMIVVNDAGIFIHNGKGASIELVGPSVMINKVALVVT